jgi:hypothetical protein
MTSPAPSQKSQPPAINAATAPSNAPKISPTIETFFMTLSIAAKITLEISGRLAALSRPAG